MPLYTSAANFQARDDGLVTVDMGPPELNGLKVPATLPTNADGMVLKEPIQVTQRRTERSSCTTFYRIIRIMGLWTANQEGEEGASL